MKQSAQGKLIHFARFADRTLSKFISLKWKISLLTSMILLVVVTIFSIINYKSLINNIDQQSEQQYQRYVREVEKLIEQISQNSPEKNQIEIILFS